MGTLNWKEIWGKKGIVSSQYDGNEFKRFCELKKANGYDVAVNNEDAYYRSFYENWLCFYEKMIELIGSDIESVYEVGCGSGVNLFMLMNRLTTAKVVGGCDYSEPMIQSAKIVMESDNFCCCGADEIPMAPQYDVVMSESVFQYFEDLEYAERVLERMIHKSKKLTYIGEIHDKEYETELLAYRRRTIEDYDKRYDGLNKLFINKKWIENIAKRHNKRVIFTTVDNMEYLNAKYEYNCYIF